MKRLLQYKLQKLQKYITKIILKKYMFESEKNVKNYGNNLYFSNDFASRFVDQTHLQI